MTTTGEFLKDLESRGIRIQRRGDELAVSGTRSALTPEIRKELAARKAELLEELEPLPDPTPTRVAPDGPQPLSFGQEQVWIIEQLAPGNGAYHVPLCLRLRGRLDDRALRTAIAGLVERHEILRTVFRTGQDGIPVQVVQPAASLDLELVECDTGEAEPTTLEQVLREAIQRPFDLEAGPVMRVTLVRIAPDVHVLLLVLHHVCCDGWSLDVLRSELFTLYGAAVSGTEPDLPPVAMQYGEYAARQREQWSGKASRRLLEHWRARLEGAPETLALPATKAPGAPHSFRGERVPVEIGADVAARFHALCRGESASLFMGVLAAYLVLLHRYTLQDDLLVGTPIALRDLPGTEQLIGNTVNALVLRTSLDGDPSGRELIDRARDTALDAFEFAGLPFEKLVAELRPNADRSRNPLFQAFLVLQPPARSYSAPDLSVTEEPVESGRSQLDLTLTLQESDAGLRGQLSFNSGLFDRADVARMARHFERIVRQIVEEPDAPISELQLHTGSEARELLVRWNQTAMPYPEELLMHSNFEAQARATPGSTALICPAAGDRTQVRLTYAELNAGANRLARHLRAKGVGPGDLVALSLERSERMLVGLLGILKTGAAYLPLDPAFPRARLTYMLEDSGARALVSESTCPELQSPRCDVVVHLDHDATAIATQGSDDLGVEIDRESSAYVIYTSGSTGKPKGVDIPHRAAVNFLLSMARWPGMTASDRLLAVTTLSFDISVLELLLPLSVGGTVVLATRDDAVDGHRLAELIESCDISLMQATPATWHLLLDTGWRAPNMRALCGGEALSPDLASSLTRACKGLFNMYGPTETTVWSSVAEVAPHSLPITIGRPIANTSLYILDRALRPVPVGVPGELYIAGDGVARGYLGREELTAERFVADPHATPARRMYRTGDLARYLPNGDIECLGRVDHQIKLRGFRIELGEIESVLEKTPGIEQAVVTAHGEDDASRKLVAYFRVSAPVSIDDVRTELRKQLPEYMVPAAYVPMESFPLTPNGKIDRRRLPAPDLSELAGRVDDTPPRDELEAALAEIWCKLLGLDSIGIHAEFFDVGGHSLLAIQMVAAIRNQLGGSVALRQVFDAPTIAGLAESLRSGGTDETRDEPIPLADRTAPLPVSFGQEQVFLIEELAPASGAYNIHLALRLRGGIDRASMQAALSDLVARHESLRTTVAVQGGDLVQVVHPTISIELQELQIGDDPDALPNALRREIQRPFDFDTGPLLRACLLVDGGDTQVLQFVIHHLVADGWSLGVLRRDFFALYDARCRGEAALLPPMRIQYADYAAWQRGRLSGPTLEAELEHWEQVLTGAPEVMDLPLDHPRPAEVDHRGARIRVQIEPGDYQRLRRLCATEGATPFMGALAAFKLVLKRHSGQDDLVLGAPIAERGRPELQALIGNTVNAIVLRTSLADNPSGRELLGRVRETSLTAFDHSDVPFEKLVERLRPKRDRSHNPIFQVLFVFESRSDTVESGVLSVEPEPVDSGRSQLDLALALNDTGEELAGYLTYRTDLFEQESAARIARHFERSVTALANEPDRPIAELPLLGDDERRILVEEWNRTALDFDRDTCLHRLFEANAARVPTQTAVVFPEEDRRISYGELNARANQLAHHLIELGVRPEDLVGLCVPRSPEMLVGLLAILKSGAGYVPLDPSFPAERLDFMVADSGTRAIVGVESTLRDLETGDALTVDLARDVAPTGDVTPNPDMQLGGDATAYVIYTSGSTGRPKGVEIQHRAAVNFLTSMAAVPGLTEGDRLLAVTTLSFDIAVLELLLPLTLGAEIVLASSTDVYDGKQLARLLEEHEISVMQATPATWRMLFDSGWQGRPDLKALCGGEPLPRELAERLAACCHELWNMYGPTETTVWSTIAKIDSGANVTIGRPIGNTQIYLLDERRELVPIGAVGELYIGGEGLARGYLARPELTEERFVPHPFSDDAGARLYRTGDLARYRADGSLDCLGRVDQQVKVRGYRIELGEIEAVLELRAEIAQAVVTLWEPQPGDQWLVAYAVRAEGAATLDDQAIRRELLRSLPHYMVPSRIIELDALPLTPNGKVDRRALPAPTTPETAPPWSEPGGLERLTDTSAWMRVRTWRRRSAGKAPTPIEGDVWVIFCDDDETGRAVADTATDLGFIAVRVLAADRYQQVDDRCFHLPPEARSNEWERLLRALRGPGQRIRMVTHLWSLAGREVVHAESTEMDCHSERGVYSLLKLIKALGSTPWEQQLALDVVGRGIAEHGAPPPDPAKALIVGPCRVLPMERPGVGVTVMEVGMMTRPGEIADSIATLPRAPGATLIVRRGPDGWEERCEAEHRVTAAPGAVRPDGLVLVTGAGSALGRIAAQALRDAGARRLLLVDRDSAAEHDLTRELASSGVDTEFRALDTLDPRAWQHCAGLGEVTGVVHCAGRVEHRPLASLPLDMAREDITLAVHGPLAMAEALPLNRLDFCLFISGAHVAGGAPGTATAAAASEFFQAFTRRQGSSVVVASIECGTLDDTGVDEPAQAGFGDESESATPAERDFVWLRARGMTPPELKRVITQALGARGSLVASAFEVDHLRERWRQTALQSGGDAPAQPRNDIERTIASIWAKAVGINGPISIRRDFFELGGHSLAAVRVAREIQLRYGVELPLRAFLEAPTVESLSRLVLEKRSGAQAPRPRFRYLVKLAEGPDSDAPPLFVAAGALGNVLNLRHLASLVGRDRPLYGIQARGLLDDDAPHRRIPHMARAYLEEVRQVQPRGPYYLSGFCSGGLIAYEMAQLLLAQGDEVALLALLDTTVPHAIDRLSFADKVRIHRQQLAARGIRYLWEWLCKRISWTIEQRKGRRSRSPGSGRSELVWDATFEAMEHYQVEPIDLRVHLLRPPLARTHDLGGGRATDKHRQFVREDNGWRDLVRELVVTELPCLPGDHDGFVLEPTVRTLARELAATWNNRC